MIDLSGQKFGRLTVVKRVKSEKYKSMVWRCKCDCGNTIEVPTSYLTTGDTKSCGCLKKETVSKMMTTHGLSKTRLYRVWAGVKNRCYNPKTDNYKYYGAKGITMCDEWKNNYMSFYRWAIAAGYDETASAQECTLDRIDNTKNYCPENCRWANHVEQCNNQNSNKILRRNGEEHTMAEWARIIGIDYSTLRARISRGMDLDAALTTEIKRK